MMSSYSLKKLIHCILFALGLVGGFFFVTEDVKAQATDCCLISKTGAYTLNSIPSNSTYDRIYNISQLPPQCILGNRESCANQNLNQSGPCVSEDLDPLEQLMEATRTEWYQWGPSRGFVQEYIDGHSTNYRTQRTCTKNIQVTGRAVTCSAYDQCASAINTVSSCHNLSQASCGRNANCFWDSRRCQSRTDPSICYTLLPAFCQGDGKTGSTACIMLNDQCVTVPEKQLGEQLAVTDRGSILPPCAFTGSCRSVNDLLVVAINAAQKLFGIMGSVALAFFIYGGIIMILSFGSPDKVKKGRDVLVAAIVGIIIAFSAYFIVGYILNALNVTTNFNYGNINTSVQ